MATLRENVVELRRALGSVSKPLSLRDFATQVDRRNPSRSIDFKMVERWERGIEPDVLSIAAMATLAGVSFEEFALGKNHKGAERDLGEKIDALAALGGVDLVIPLVSEGDDEGEGEDPKRRKSG